MTFNVKQLRQLRARLKDRHVRERVDDGVTLRYLEGWHVIAEANRIFGFDGWHRETVESRCVYTKTNGARYQAVYVARVRVTVNADEQEVIREGSGSGDADTTSPGQAHEFALKAAETDATKRALMTFGNAFGLSLYANLKRSDTQVGERAPAGPTQEPNAGPLTDSDPEEEAPKRRFPETKPNGKTALARHKNGDPAQERIDKSALTLGEPKRLRNPEHLKFVVRHGCVICGKNRVHAHHLTFAQPNALGRKVSDEFTVPLCPTHHRELHHAGNEQEWWKGKGIDPVARANELWSQSHRRG